MTSPKALAGVNVLDLSDSIGGAYCTKQLADLGTEVVLVERPGSGHPLRQAGSYSAGTDIDSSGLFLYYGANKWSVVCDIETITGRERVRDLASRADIFVESFQPGYLDSIGLGYTSLSSLNPALVHISVTHFGQTGPYRSTLFYADPVTGAHAAIAILAALHHRETTGEGQYVDMSLHENGITFFPEAILEYTVTGSLARRRGNRHPLYAPQGCYPSYGDDSWLALCVRTLEEWKSLAGIIGRPDLAEAPVLSTSEGRRARYDELDNAISEWTRQYDHNEAAAKLQQVGVPAAPVLANWEIVSNPHFHARKFYIPMEHPEVGVFPYPGMPWKLPETPGVVRAASPLYGEHNSDVFRGLLGLSGEELAPLYVRRTIADHPSPDLPAPVRPQRAK